MKAKSARVPVPSSNSVFGIATLLVLATVAVAIAGVVFAAWRTIDPGYVGIVFDKADRRVTNTLDPGWVFINPFSQSVTHYPVSIQTLVMVREAQEGAVSGDDSVKVGSREGQSMQADVSVQYSVEKDQAARLYEAWAGAPIERIEENLVRQVTRSALNDVASQYGWEQIYGEKRLEYTERVSTEMQRRLGDKFVKFESLNLRGWHLPENLQRALEQKIAAQQAAEQQAFALRQAEIKAQQDQVQAQGEANAIRARAEGEAAATKIRAEAQAEANRQLSESLTPDLLRYEQLQRWDGKLPVFNGGGATPLVDVTGVISGTTP
jgi:regulator of protease activity HflC (stomatin/prohibitin superfamily)